MTQTIPTLNILPTSVEPIQVEFFDPPVCCLQCLGCPTLDPALLDVNGLIRNLHA